MNITVRRALSVVLAAAVGVLVAAQLTAYDVETPLLLTAGLGVAGAVGAALMPTARPSRTYTCPRCPAAVELAATSAAEESRLQALVTVHENHSIRR
ncbi:hypothetical protein [Streptomyces sp. NRRL F-2890]|uniref:hypothetical protein n=1 Tax=Streptomyces sp. NRRL F-2890 TaxID=1463845 RepID=UPI0004CA64AA|nr:hypothetical protein [Streptomyces sp. NRRL F-2890]